MQSQLNLPSGRSSYRFWEVRGQIVPSDPSQKDPDLEQDQSKRRVAVDFTMEGLLDFKNTCQAVSMGRPADESRGKLRKRPNYNGAMRKHLAKLQDRVP